MSMPEIIIRQNTVTGEVCDADGNYFAARMPSVSVKSKFLLKWYLYTETRGINEGNGITDWIPDTQYENCGALLTCDNDFIHRINGKLATAISAGSAVTEMTVTISNSADSVKIPQAGFVRIISATGELIDIAYTARTISGTSVIFTVEFTATETFEQNITVKILQQPYFQAVFDPVQSDPANGMFAFEAVAYSTKLASVADTANSRYIACEGIELLPYFIGEDNSYNESPSFICETFGLTINMGEAGTNFDVPTPIENEIAAMVNAAVAELLAKIEAPHIYQYSADGQTSWHDTFQSGDKYMRERADFDGAEWSDAYPISPPTVFTQAIEYFFNTTAGQSAAITFTAADLGIAADAQPQVSLWHYESDGGLLRVADTTYNAKWYDGTLIITYYQAWSAGRWQLKLS